MKMLALLLLALPFFSGCEFARGVRDEGARQAVPIFADLALERLPGEFSELRKSINDLPAKMPQPDPAGGGALYSAGTLLALLIANGVKGAIRKRMESNEEEKTS